MLYNKAIEYFSALNDERHFDFLQKLQKLFLDDNIQKLMNAGNDKTVEVVTITNASPATQQNGGTILNQNNTAPNTLTAIDSVSEDSQIK